MVDELGGERKNFQIEFEEFKFLLISLPVKDVYRHPAFEGVDWGPRSDTPKKKHHVDKITQVLQEIDDGSSRLSTMIVKDLANVVRGGRIQLDESWEKYMVASRFSRTSTDSKFAKASLQEKKVRQLLHSWCNGSVIGWSRLSSDPKGWEISVIKSKELQTLKVNQETVSLAIDFHTFSMAWRSSFVYDSIAYALAHFKIVSAWPRVSNKLIDKLSKNCNPKILSKVDGFHKVMKMLQVTMPYREEPIRCGGVLEYQMHVLNDFIFVSQMLRQPSINEEYFSRFWTSLELFSSEIGIENLANDFQEIWGYFSNGRRFDMSFEYYNLLSKIGLNIHKEFESERLKPLSTGANKIPKDEVVASTKNSSHFYHTLFKDVTDGQDLVFHKFQFSLHYVEELLKEVKKSKNSLENFYPRPRVTKPQLLQIAQLAYDYMMPIYQDNEFVTNYNLNVELEGNKFPVLIQGFFFKFLGTDYRDKRVNNNQLANMIKRFQRNSKFQFGKKYMEFKQILSRMELELESGSSKKEEIKIKFSNEIWDAMVECENQLMLPHDRIVIHQHKIEHKQFDLVLTKYLNYISLINAEKLIKLIGKGNQLRRNSLIVNRLYYFMMIKDEKEKRSIFLHVGKELKILKEKMIPEEWNVLWEIYESTRKKIKPSAYSIWKEQVILKITKLPFHSAKILDDILFDCSKEYLLTLYEGESLEETYGKINEELLSEDSKRKLEFISELWKIQDIDRNIVLNSPENLLSIKYS
ncbi:hypothetical protein PGT21_014790 [Puccinia graminis f. sp. tritici]|uniref:Uncharacterized protein n=1 Tax=Puccinia graminis f. sp. tritici TaxID=56615 RepID=A0A5B0PGB7_PUCGR|nr:hypothetical protein PGTUg99_012569 [Puccinia graminis f. sp. tritici]KAA1099614.1 hypothetical protein PGT21_014790 [Puccinia graminis f. sp. tritici]